MKMILLLWISFVAALLNVSVSQSPNQVESCISYSSSEEAFLNIIWNNENVDLSRQQISIRYQAVGGNVLKVISCFDENNITGIDLFDDTADQTVEVATTDNCTDNSLPQNVIGSAIATFGYISDVDTALSGDNSSIIVTCSLACQTDFITGCSISLSGCGEQTTLSCTVDGSFEYRPRQCSVEFQNLLPTSYLYTASVMADIDMPLMREENVLSITGSFATSDPNNFSCERPTSETNITTTNINVPNGDSNIGGNSSNPDNTNVDNSTMTNSTIPNDDISNPIANDTSKDDISPVTDSPNIHTPSPSPMNEDFSNSTMGEGDDESILDTIESLPVPAIASVGAVILIMIIVVTILLIVCCRMKRSSKNDKSKQHGVESGTDCASFTFQNSTQALFGGHADSCSEVRSNNQSSITASSSVDQLPSYDHLEKSYQAKESSPISQGSSNRNSDVNNHIQNRDSSFSALDDELLDDFDYDEIEEPTNDATTSTQYNNLVHSGKEQRLKIDNPPAPSSGTYERLSQPPTDDNYAVPPELDDVELNEAKTKSTHEYEVPPDVNHSLNSEDNTNTTYDHLSPKPFNVYDRVASGFQYDYPTNSTLSALRKNQYDTLLPKVPVVGQTSQPDSQSNRVVTQQPSPYKVQHSPGPLTGDMYTVPKKFEIKSSTSFHDYDIVADAFDGGQSTVF
ncbi:uncharacterized protein [Dysidea avara]|uniref:uncharacterized protein isoform X2 n=1 Tax=Dysidea avara TaxID=196820 RepID=UPI00331CC9FF